MPTRSRKAFPSTLVANLDRQSPLTTEVNLVACLRMRGDYRGQQPTVVNLPADLAIPGVTAPQLLAIEPHLDTGTPQRDCYSLGSRRVL
jgi:hypothetical protein